MKKILHFLVFALFSLTYTLFGEPREAIVITPVADLIVDPYSKTTGVESHYRNQPFSGTWSACKRAHQLLFNERVKVIAVQGPEVKVQISNFYFLKPNDSIPCDTYWTLKKNLLFLADIKDSSFNKKIPPPIDYKDFSNVKSNGNNVITLKKPFYDAITKEIYSVGTRFIALKGQKFIGNHEKGYFDVYILDHATRQIKTTQVPKQLCIRNYSKTTEDKIQNFVQVLKLWASQKDGAIPYVLGGWSWTVLCDDNEVEISSKSQDHYAIERKKWKHTQKMGLDCMGLIGRAAQICEIPFYLKNTTTLIKNLQPLKKNEPVEEGDIIFYPGHVMVVSSVKKSLVIEARGYDRGEGKVQENPIENIFEGVKDLEELKKCFLEKKPITILYADGREWKTFKKFKILKIKSVFKNKT